MSTKKRTVTVNAESKLFCIPEGTKYYSCLGFDVLETRANALARELSAKGALVYEPKAYGTLSRYEQYRELCEIAYDIHKRTGCLLYTSPSPRDRTRSRMPSSA